MLWFRIKGTSPFSSSYYRNGLKNTNIFFLYLSKIGVHVWDTCDCILKWPVLQMGTYIVFLSLNQLNSSIQCKIKKKVLFSRYFKSNFWDFRFQKSHISNHLVLHSFLSNKHGVKINMFVSTTHYRILIIVMLFVVDITYLLAAPN